MQFLQAFFILSVSSLAITSAALPTKMEVVSTLLQSLMEDQEKALNEAKAEEKPKEIPVSEGMLQQIPVSEGMLQQIPVSEQQIPVSEGMLQQIPVSQTLHQKQAIEAMMQDNLEAAVNQELSDSDKKVDAILHILKATYYDKHDVGKCEKFAAFSCAELLKFKPDTPSGDYWILNVNGNPSLHYCDMTRSCGGVTGGWMQVAALDMTDSDQQCPSTLWQRSDNGKRSCAINLTGCGCSGVSFPVKSAAGYSKVCGKVIGYQIGSMDTFFNIGRGANPGIDTYYVDGVSITRGSPREHIWTLAAGLHETGAFPQVNCRCTNPSQASKTTPPPSYVGDDYFCDTGAHENFVFHKVYTKDPLWDGAGCGGQNQCCSFNKPPWFYKDLTECTTDSIEVRLCRDQPRADEDVSVEMIEIYVQ